MNIYVHLVGLHKEVCIRNARNGKRASVSRYTGIACLARFKCDRADVYAINMEGIRNVCVCVYIYILLLLVVVVSPWARLDRNQNPVGRQVWLWYAASWASS
jgi:hypothetical protein